MKRGNICLIYCLGKTFSDRLLIIVWSHLPHDGTDTLCKADMLANFIAVEWEIRNSDPLPTEPHYGGESGRPHLHSNGFRLQNTANGVTLQPGLCYSLILFGEDESPALAEM